MCGGGNAVHVLASLIGAQPEHDVSILSLFSGEAKRLQNSIIEEGIRCINDRGDDVYGRPVVVTACTSEIAQKNVDIVILALPSFTHESYLKALKPHLKPGLLIGAMPGEGGFDFTVRHILGNDFLTASSVFAL